MSTISKMSPEAANDFRDLYNKNPNVIESLCDYPGEIGRLAEICKAVGCES